MSNLDVDGRDSPGSNSGASSANGADGQDNAAHNTNSKPTEKRVPLACHRCRAKRARCSGERPVCRSCMKVGEECIWPAGRKRKRTRREMEADERQEREAALRTSSAGNAISRGFEPDQQAQYSPLDSQGSSHSPRAQSWPFSAVSAPSPYTWPPASQTSPVPDPSSPSSPQAVPLAPSGSAADTAQLIQALHSPVAFIDGDPLRQEGLELYYYRFSGSTAIHPGINRIALKLRPRSPNPLQSNVPAPVPTSHSRPSSPEPPPEMFDVSGMPAPTVYMPLLTRFFETMSQHFPSISRRRMEERLETGTMSAFLMNCICAISARFQPHSTTSPANACAPFITKAQELIIPLLHLPTTDVVTGLLLLSWANFGQNSESGQWEFAGMAFRMSQDLGLHEVSEIYESSAHVVRTRLLFWSLFITDRIISFSTGRPPAISEDIIEIPLPSDEDIVPDPAHNNVPSAAQETVQPTSFVYLVRLMILCGRIANVLNGRRGRNRTLLGPSTSNPEALSTLQKQLVQFVSDMPPLMKWNVDSFKHQNTRGHGGIFLTLHLWANAVLAMIYHPELVINPSGMETPMTSNMHRCMTLALSSSRIITECLVFADLLSSQSYLATPFISQPMFVASLAFIYDMKYSAMGFIPAPKPVPHPNRKNGEHSITVDGLLTSLTRQNLDVLTGALKRMEHYWSGIGYILNVLHDRAVGAGLGHLYNSGDGKSKKTFISLPDRGLVQRFSGLNLPHNVAAPTDTSLRESIMQDQVTHSSGHTPPIRVNPMGNDSLRQDSNMCSLDELLSSYSVEGMFVSPADSYDIGNLLNMGGVGGGFNTMSPDGIGTELRFSTPSAGGQLSVNGHVEGTGTFGVESREMNVDGQVRLNTVPAV